MKPWRIAAPLMLLCVLAVGAQETIAPKERLGAVDGSQLGYVFGFSTFRPQYELASPGSYRLPVISSPGDHAVVDSDGTATTLFRLAHGKLAVLNFIYTSCNEATGCPFSRSVLEKVDRAVANDTKLADRVVLITLSFDPQRDTPPRMALLRQAHGPRSSWHFVTTRSEDEVRPILTDFDQPVSKLRFPDGQWSGVFRHVLKVFLLDEQGRVRNVYSVGFLDADLVLDDLRTLAMASTAER
jgi:cytochrome c peroxidase